MTQMDKILSLNTKVLGLDLPRSSGPRGGLRSQNDSLFQNGATGASDLSKRFYFEQLDEKSWSHPNWTPPDPSRGLQRAGHFGLEPRSVPFFANKWGFFAFF